MASSPPNAMAAVATSAGLVAFLEWWIKENFPPDITSASGAAASTTEAGESAAKAAASTSASGAAASTTEAGESAATAAASTSASGAAASTTAAGESAAVASAADLIKFLEAFIKENSPQEATAEPSAAEEVEEVKAEADLEADKHAADLRREANLNTANAMEAATAADNTSALGVAATTTAAGKGKSKGALLASFFLLDMLESMGKGNGKGKGNGGKS